MLEMKLVALLPTLVFFNFSFSLLALAISLACLAIVS